MVPWKVLGTCTQDTDIDLHQSARGVSPEEDLDDAAG